MEKLTQPKLMGALGVAVPPIFLAATNPDAADFREWYLEKHGLAGMLFEVED